MELLDIPRAPAEDRPARRAAQPAQPGSPVQPRQRRAPGRRSAHVARQRRAARRQRTRSAAVRGLLAVVLVAAVAAAGMWLGDLRGVRTGGDTPTADAPVAGAVDQTTVLLIREDPAVRGAAGITLLAAGADGSASATFIPSTTLVEIPGVGLDQLGQAQHYGGGALTRAAVENALGISIDHVASIGQAELGALLQRIGGAEITLDQRLVDRAADGTGTVAFEAGTQFLNGVRLADLWAFVQRGESELDTFPRQQRALDAVLGALSDDVLRESLLAEVPGELDTDADAPALRAVLGTLAEAAEDRVVSYHLLPVEPFGSGDDLRATGGAAGAEAAAGASYQLREDEVADLVATALAGSVPEGGTAAPVRVQVLNGVGVPGVGRQVDEAIEGLGLQITLTENARSFDFPTTQIVIYAETPEMLRAARQAQEALGVGTILVSRQPQSVVEMTIVVGADFLGERTPPSGAR